jgi:hypothetical protein
MEWQPITTAPFDRDNPLARDATVTAPCRSSFLAFLSQPEHLAAQVKIVA